MVSVAPHNRAIDPVLGGISGSTKTIWTADVDIRWVVVGKDRCSRMYRIWIEVANLKIRLNILALCKLRAVERGVATIMLLEIAQGDPWKRLS